ncbi:serine hydrolase [uncultured Phenylobacterium sp.]|uniref:serine hydrolase domain-containing protein n=1 Tax=uncultured Phenylobacterium sp. TaxID=349273 RepID=UPI0025F756D0|nr:serine hydrolase domain-containing protein [uncultured Phenylobacterium sp.]
MTSQPIQDLLDRAVAAGAAPGLTASVAGPDGRDAHYAAGVRGIADPRPMTPDSVFWIASCTKAITSAAALQLVERGLLDLDEPVGGRLPMLATPQVLEELDADGAARLRPARRPVTLRALLTHTSGLAYDFLHAGLARHYAATGDSLAGSLTTAPLLVFDPGDDWQYGVGIDVAGWLVAAASGQSLPDYFAQHIFGPLGMADTGFTPGAALSDRMVGMHSRGPDGTFEAASAFPSAPEMYGGGGLYSTAPDYLKFLRAVLADDGAGVLGPQALALLRQGDSRVGAAGHLITAAPPLSHDFRPMPDTPRSHTLGFLRNEADIPGRRRAGSLAWGGLANCYYWADPASGVAAMLCAQFLPFADPRMLEVFDAFERAVYAA